LRMFQCATAKIIVLGRLRRNDPGRLPKTGEPWRAGVRRI